MALNDLKLKLSYRTGRDDLVKGFFVPCMEQSLIYRRAAGYFTSSGLALAARGVASLALRGAVMKLVVSPYLEQSDVEALQSARNNPISALSMITAKSLADIEGALIRDRLNALAWLSAAGLLEIKLALRLNELGEFTRGLFHEKTGVFTDEQGNHVSFSGSSNETAGGLVENFESIKVFCSWKDTEGRVQEEIENFDALWNNTTPGLSVLDFSEAANEILDKYRDPAAPPQGISNIKIPRCKKESSFRIPPWLSLRPYQEEAIRAWSKAGGKGVFAMATGAGKTLTALTLAAKLSKKNSPFVLIIVCPFINLCKQWIRELTAFGIDAIDCFEGRDKWQAKLDESYQGIAVGLFNEIAIVTTNSTFSSLSFQSRIKPRIDAGSLYHFLVADEVHNLGAENIKGLLPEGIQMRLGLSATPERHHDPIGTSAVLGYFGGIVYEYSLAQAIADGRLCQYRYYPIPVELNDKEIEAYEEISQKLSKFFPGEDLDSDLNQAAMLLLIKRARILSSAVNKLKALDDVLSSLPEKPQKAIFYCGDGRTTDAITDDEVRQIQAVARLIGERHDLRVRNFTSRESSQDREEILRDLSAGFLDGVVAIRCLDEGIDLPELRMGFLLASSTNPRQFIQRRGRLLRNSPGKNRAIIYDFFVSPPDFGGKQDDTLFNMERSFFKKELSRIIEFCRMAENGHEALHSLHALRLKYNLLSA